MIDVPEEGATLDTGGPRVRIDPNATHAREVDDEAVIDRAEPGALWPPLRTAMSSPWSRPKPTAEMTSATSAGRTMSAGRRSIMPFWTRRASS